MVSIFAQEVYNESSTFEVTNEDEFIGNNILDNSPDEFIATNLSYNLSSLLYLETVNISFEVITIDVLNIFAPDFEQFEINVDVPKATKNGIDVFGDLSNETTVVNESITANQTFTNLGGEATFTVDSYVDETLQIQPQIKFDGPNNAAQVDGNQTIQIDASMEFIGRTV